MALRWIEGLETYGTDTSKPADGVWHTFACALTSSGARTGTHAALLGFAVGSGMIRSVGAAGNTFGVGFAVKYAGTGNDEPELVQFQRAANGEPQITLRLVYDGATDRFRLSVRRGDYTGTEIALSAPVFDRQNYEHVEMRVFIHDTNGSVEVRLNEVTVISATGLDTQNQGTDEINYVAFLKRGAVGNVLMDDMFLWDTTGGANDTFLGAQRVYMVYPDGDTAQSDWGRNQGSTDFENIAEAAPDDDTTYIDAATAADVSEFSLESLPAEVTSVAGCQVYYRSRKDSSGACDVQPALVSSGQVAAGDNRALAESWAYQGPIQDVIETDPNTGAPWTPAAINAALLRFTRTA